MANSGEQGHAFRMRHFVSERAKPAGASASRQNHKLFDALIRRKTRKRGPSYKRTRVEMLTRELEASTYLPLAL